MSALTFVVDIDPTLEAVDRAIEEKHKRDERIRPYLGMSSIGDACWRKLWYGFRWASESNFTAETIKRFDDGHAGEALQAARLKAVPGIELHTIDPETGGQIGFSDLGGHFKGHADGAIHGIIKAPATWHVWEHKQVGDTKFKDFLSCKIKYGEKGALNAWDATYYGQAVLYMHYSGMTRHYLTASTPGGRKTSSARTEANKQHAITLIEKAKTIIHQVEPSPRISDDPTWYQCKQCNHPGTCHLNKVAQKNCRTCVSATPEEDGTWTCSLLSKTLEVEDQHKGCGQHLYIPMLIPYANALDSGKRWISYEHKSTGLVFANIGEGCDLSEANMGTAVTACYTSDQLMEKPSHIIMTGE